MPSPLNDRALHLIEAVHRGFLYQHLFAVGCLLLAHPAGVRTVAVERDEDVELVFDGNTRYVQVKTRQRPLILADLDSTLRRFAEIAAEHSSGRRRGRADFWIVTNSTAAPALLDHVRHSNICIRFVTPENPPPADAHSPPAWPTVAAAIDWCIDAAGHIQFTGLSAQTLTWKLATEVAIACTGERPGGHSIEVTQLPELFEQLVVALQRVPAAPVPYIPQSSEPTFASRAPVRLIVGLSGAGKTAWVAQSALHAQQQLVYFDAASILPTALPSAISQEVAAHFLTQGDVAARDAILPGASGLDALAALSRFSHDSGRHILVVCDNAHLVGLETLQRVVQHAPAFRWSLVAQPWPDVPAVETYFGISSEQLGGFSLEAIAEVFSSHGCPVDVATADLIHDISAGLPLFVKDAARLTERYYGGDPNRFAREVTAGTHSTSTGQEAILLQVIHRLSPSARTAAALLSIPEVHLEHQECLQFLADSTGDRPDSAAAHVRELTAWGVVQHYYTGSIALHDAFGLSAAVLKHELSTAVLDSGRRSLARILRASFGRGKFDRLMMFFRLAPLIGESDTLVDISNSLSEHIQERGKADELLRILEDASSSDDVEPINRFWAYDTVTFWRMRDCTLDEATRRLHHLETLHSAAPAPTTTSRQSLLLKQMLLAGRQGDASLVYTHYRALARMPGSSSEVGRVQRYDYALALYHCQRYPQARIVLQTVSDEYFRKLHLTPRDLFGTSIPRLAGMLGDQKEEYEELKRFADTLDLQARVLLALDLAPVLLKMWAHKLYVLAHAPTSAVTVGLDVVDDILALLNDAPAARNFLENALLPAVEAFGLLGHLLDVRATYAVVLAYCGEIAEARAIMTKLAAFQPSSVVRAQLDKQRLLVESIARGNTRLTPGERLPLPGPALPPARRPHRNALCVCGSDLKFKRCCGR